MFVSRVKYSLNYSPQFFNCFLRVIRRLVSLISKQAVLEAQCAASIKQAKSASETAEQFMKTAEKGAHKNAVDESMLEELDDVKKKLSKKEEELRKVKLDFNALKVQAENANIEYDRVLTELQNSQVIINIYLQLSSYSFQITIKFLTALLE